MGYLKDIHGMTLLGNVPEGTCPECAVPQTRSSRITGTALHISINFTTSTDAGRHGRTLWRTARRRSRNTGRRH